MKKSLAILFAICVILINLQYACSLETVEITKTQKIEETDSSFIWSSGWVSEGNSLASAGTWRSANKIRETVNITFYGTGISLIYAKGPSAASAEIEIDGIYIDTINASSEKQIGAVRRILSQNLPAGEHVLGITVIEAGSKNPFVIDAVEVASKTIKQPESGSSGYLVSLIVLIIIGISAFFIFKERIVKILKPKIPKPAIPVHKEKPGKTSTMERAHDIMKTLDEKDKKIVDFLIEKNGNAKQSQIRHALEMPRSTLSKRIKILQRKNIISTKNFGKTNIVELTPWFLSKEKKKRT